MAAVSAFVLEMFALSPLYTFPHWPILALSSKRDVLPFSNGVKSKNNHKKKKKPLLCYSVKKYVVKSEPFIFSIKLQH